METTDFYKYLVGAISAIITTLTVWIIQRHFTKDKLKLTYTISSSDPFPSASETAQAFTITLENAGNKPIVDCSFLIRFASGKIDSFKFSNDRLLSEIKKTDRTVESAISLINPKDNLQLVVTCKSEENVELPFVEAKAFGVNAQKKSSGGKTFLIICLIFIFAIGGLAYLGGKEDEAPQRQDYIFAAVNEAGLSNLIPQIIGLNSEGLTYKNAAFFLFHNFLIDQKNKEKYIIALQKLSEIEGMNKNSKGTIFYILAKAEQYDNNKPKADEYFRKCNDIAPDTYEFLMAHDAAYDLKNLQKGIEENQRAILTDSIN
jgi:hypothetical protein